ncbi:hypothetical protein ACFE04_031091 [Oxalis oulophora]
MLNPWERNENHTLALNSAKAIRCTVVNIGTHDFIEGRRHLVLGVISQIIKWFFFVDGLIHKPTRCRGTNEFAGRKDLIEKSAYKKIVSNFSTDIKHGKSHSPLLCPATSSSQLRSLPRRSPQSTVARPIPSHKNSSISPITHAVSIAPISAQPSNSLLESLPSRAPPFAQKP